MTKDNDRAATWNRVRDQIKRMAAGIGSEVTVAPALLDEVYRRRAVQLARRHLGGAAAKTIPALVFRLGQERYAIELAELAEVLPYRGSTPVPGAPPALIGVMNVRGAIRAVADLRRVLEVEPAADSTGGYVLLLRRREGTVGFKVDTLEQVRQIDPAQFASGADSATAIPGLRFVKALTTDTIILIDADAALSHLIL